MKKNAKKASKKKVPFAVESQPEQGSELAIAQVFAQIELTSVRMISANASMLISGKKIPGKLSTALEAGFGANLDERTLLSNVSVKARAFVDHESDGQSSAELSAVFQCIFHPSEQLDLAIETFRQNGIAIAITQAAVQIAWPYIRHHIQSTFSSMCLPPFTVPLMKFGLAARMPVAITPRD